MDRTKLNIMAKHLGFFCVLFLLLYISENFALAQSIPDPRDVLGKDKFPEELKAAASGTTAAEKITYVTRMVLAPAVKYIFISVSIIFIVFYGIYLVIATSEEEISEQKDNLLWAAIGFALLGIATHIVDGFNPYQPTPSPAGIGNIDEATEGIRSIILYIELVVGAVASLFIMISAVRMIVSQGDEEEMNKQKRNFTWGLIGLMIIMLAEVAVQVFYEMPRKTGGSKAAADKAIAEMIGIVNFILYFLGAVTVLTLIIGSFYYLTSFGNEEATNRAKNILIGAVVAAVMIISSFAFIATFAR